METPPSPLFTVVVPVYDRAARIGPTLRSLIAQTETDWECLVVDDGSHDGDELAAAVAAFGDPRLRVVRVANGGPSAARNVGIRAARGRFVAFLDSDDLYLPEKLARQAAALGRLEPGTVALCYTRLLVERGVGRTWIKPPRGIRPGERVDEYLFCDRGWMQTSTMAVTTGLARDVLFDETMRFGEESDFAIRCAARGARIVPLDDALVVMEDVYDPSRLSKQADHRPLLAWSERRRGILLSERAYWGFRGWHCARMAAATDVGGGLRLFLTALFRRPWTAKLTLVVAGQVVVPQGLYQRLATAVVRRFGRSAASPSAGTGARSGPSSPP